jgi:hypothetical protein
MKEVNKLLQSQLDKMSKNGRLFRSKLSGNDVWDLYLNSFLDGDDTPFRDPESTEHNCNHCKNFIRRYGNIVTINSDGNLSSIFDVNIEGEYKNPFSVINENLINAGIENVFFETYDELNSLPYESCKKNFESFKLGVESNMKRYTKEEAELYGVVNAGEVKKFEHFTLQLPKEFVDVSGKSMEAIQALYRDKYSVFKRAMTEVPLDTLELVRDLINQGSLLDGTAQLEVLEQFILHKKDYNKSDKSDEWFWDNTYTMSERLAKFKNTLIGVLCTELAEGMELNKACQNWNKRVDPVNYMKASAPITKKQIEEAKKFVEENGYEASFKRRMATIDDIKVSEILHSNVGDGKLKEVSIFDNVKSTTTRHKRSEFEGLEEVDIEKFMKNILPGCTSVEMLVNNSHNNNFVSLTTADDPDSKPIFKWDNNYSWTFNGNLAGKSQIKEQVKLAGGNVEGILRGSVTWNEGGSDNSDLDNWCSQPDGIRIGFSAGYRKDQGNRFSPCSGQLDLDNTGPGKEIGVENIYFTDINSMKDGVYKFWVNQYADRGSKGFKYEIEFGNESFTYEYNKSVYGNVHVAEVTLKNGKFTIKHLLPESNNSKEIYGVNTNEFHKVNLVCKSPNHWGDNKVGNLHYFFMLEGTKSPINVRGFHNENLLPDLLKHRKVMEVLGNTNMVESKKNQLSGLGFNSTVRDEVIVKLSGTHKRMIKIKF